MRANAFEKLALVAAVVAAGAMSGAAAGRAQGFAAAKPLPAMAARPPLILVQNAFTPFSLPETGEPPVSPINPGSLPGSTAAIGGSATGTNPVTGLPCNGSGSISVSGAGGLPGTATPPPSEFNRNARANSGRRTADQQHLQLAGQSRRMLRGAPSRELGQRMLESDR